MIPSSFPSKIPTFKIFRVSVRIMDLKLILDLTICSLSALQIRGIKKRSLREDQRRARIRPEVERSERSTQPTAPFSVRRTNLQENPTPS